MKIAGNHFTARTNKRNTKIQIKGKENINARTVGMDLNERNKKIKASSGKQRQKLQEKIRGNKFGSAH